MKLAPPTIESLWDEYEVTGSVAARNRIAENYLPEVQYTANVLATRVPRGTIDADDLLSVGMIGLTKCIKTFDRSRKIKFFSFASLRVRGEMLDYMRDHSRIARLTQQRLEKAARFREKYLQTHGYNPTIEELAEACGARVARTFDMHKELIHLNTKQFASEPGSEFESEQVPRESRIVDPHVHLLAQEMMDVAASRFKLSEALILKFYFFEHWTLKRIGAELIHKTESRVSQMMTDVLAKLRVVA